MRPYRNLKIASVIEHELGLLLAREGVIEGALVTIMSVEVTTDLLQAGIKVGIIPYEKAPEAFKELQKRRSRLQHLLLKKMNIRPMPQIRFSVAEPEKIS